MKVKKNKKYFLNVEKRHYNQGAISQLKLGNETFVTTDKQILSECETFDKNLYSSNNGSQNEQADNAILKRKRTEQDRASYKKNLQLSIAILANLLFSGFNFSITI